MSLITLAPEILVDRGEVRTVRMESNTDAFEAKHVVLDFENHSLEIPPEFTFDEIAEALRGGCYYRPKYLDQADTVDICVVHDDISEHPYTGNARDAYRRCVRNDPLAQFGKMFMSEEPQFEKNHAAPGTLKNYNVQYYDDTTPPGFFSWFRKK